MNIQGCDSPFYGPVTVYFWRERERESAREREREREKVTTEHHGIYSACASLRQELYCKQPHCDTQCISACKYVSIALRARSSWRDECLAEDDGSETEMEGREQKIWWRRRRRKKVQRNNEREIRRNLLKQEVKDKRNKQNKGKAEALRKEKERMIERATQDERE